MSKGSGSGGGGNVSTGFTKCFILFMAILILVQGAAYCGLAVWGITRNSCNAQTTNVAEKPFDFVFELIYFSGEDCAPPAVQIADNQDPMQIPVDMATTTTIHNRMEIFLITYAAVSALWVVTSLLVISTICGPVTNLTVGLSFWPWIVVVMAGSVLDAVATGFHVHDIINTVSVDKLFAFLGIENNGHFSADEWSVFTDYMGSYSSYFVTPSVVLTCISSRVVIIWLLNIFGTCFCMSLAKVLKTPSKAKDSGVSSVAATAGNEAAHNNNNNNNNQLNSESSVQAISRQQSEATLQDQKWQYEAQEPEQLAQPRQSVPVRILPPPPSSYQQPQSPQQQQPQQFQQPQSPQSPQQQQQQPQQFQQPQMLQQQQSQDGNMRQRRHPEQSGDNRPRLLINDTTYRNTDTHPDRIDYPAQATMPPTSAGVQSGQISAGGLNSRYAANDNMFAGYSQSPPSGQPGRISQDLRNQLPWSYTGNAAPMPPRKPQVQIYPQIPEPDYGDN